MGLRDKADRLKGAASAGLDDLLDSETLANLKDASAATGELVRQSPLADMDVAALAATAATSARVVNADAELSKWRMARAAMTPRSTASRVVKALGAEVIRQTLDKDDQAPALGAPDDPEGDPDPS